MQMRVKIRILPTQVTCFIAGTGLRRSLKTKFTVTVYFVFYTVFSNDCALTFCICKFFSLFCTCFANK